MNIYLIFRILILLLMAYVLRLIVIDGHDVLNAYGFINDGNIDIYWPPQGLSLVVLKLYISLELLALFTLISLLFVRKRINLILLGSFALPTLINLLYKVIKYGFVYSGSYLLLGVSIVISATFLIIFQRQFKLSNSTQNLSIKDSLLMVLGGITISVILILIFRY